MVWSVGPGSNTLPLEEHGSQVFGTLVIRWNSHSSLAVKIKGERDWDPTVDSLVLCRRIVSAHTPYSLAGGLIWRR